MKVRLRIAIIFCLCTAVQSFGQTDTLKQFPDGNGFNVDGKFRDRTLAWSVNFVDGIWYEYHLLFKYGLGTKMEYKLSDHHSLGAGINLLIYEDRSLFSSYDITNVNLEIELGYRYYHNLRKRMSKGQMGNNFSANYFLISPYLGLMYMPDNEQNCQWDFEEEMWAIDYYSAVKAFPGLRLGYGLQRNFKGNWNLDINGGIQFQPGIHSNNIAEKLYLQFSIGYILK